MTTRCGHTFCQVCINRVVKGKNALCPLCNTRMNRRGIVENDKVRGVVKAVHILISNAQKDITDMGYEDGKLEHPRSLPANFPISLTLS